MALQNPQNWLRITSRADLPPENLVVDTKVEDERGMRMEQRMKFHSNHWWVSDDLFVYYNPTHWKYIKL